MGRYPSLIFALKNCHYEWSLQNCDNDSLISKAMQEMANKPYLDTWHSKVQNIETLLGLPRLHGCKDSVSNQLNKKLKSLFDRFWLDEICCEKLGIDGLDHNKLSFYKTLKSSFTREPYIFNIPNPAGLANQIPG